MKPELIYCHDFGGGVTAKATIPYEAPENLKNFRSQIEWSSKPRTERIVRSYVVWMNSILQLTVDRWGVKLINIYQVESTRFEIWIFKPGTEPERHTKLIPPTH